MNNKLLLLILFIFISSISAVNAQDSISDDIGICDFQTNQLTLGYQSTAEAGSFTELNDEISKIISGGSFTLKKDYTYNSNDSDYKNGIKITQDNIVIDGSGHTINGAVQARIFDIVSNNVTLKNINFVNGHSSGNGGAIYVENGFSNCEIDSTFINNSANAGGAIYFGGNIANMTIKGYFEGNSAEKTGGAIAVQGESINNTIASEFYDNCAKTSGGAMFFRSLVENNQFESIFRYNDGAYGAGIFFYNKANNNRFNSDFRFNVAQSCGGAMFFYYTTNYNNFSGYFINNSALGKIDSSNGNGGAITFKNTSCNSIFTCDFVNNTAVLHGGGVNYRQTPYNITFNSNFINNKAKYGGGTNFFETFENVIFNGIFIGNSAENGGAIAINNGVIENTSFWNNAAERRGGAIYFEDGGTVRNCEFNNNSFIGSYEDGGAVYFTNDGVITDCNFTNNKAVYYAGAVYFGMDGKIYNSNFNNNDAQSGGAVYVYGVGEVDNCNFTNNKARTGGAIDFWESGIVYNSNFNNNFASFSGGAIYCSDDLKLTNCILNNNSVEVNAGGAAYIFGKADINQCSFTNNSADVGGAAYLGGDGGKIFNSTFFDNFAKDKGGAIFLRGSNSNFYNLVFTGNNASKGSAIYKVEDATDLIIAKVIFGKNRANSTEIRIVVDGNESLAPTNKVAVHVYLLGNDNIANAIWNDGGTDTIKLANISCEFSQDGDGRKWLKFNENALQNSTDAFVDNSMMWQSPKDNPVEDAQLLDILITNEDGSVILYNLTGGSVQGSNTENSNLLLMSGDSDIKVTDVDGKITIELENLKAGTYNIKSKHVGDGYYTELENDSTFVIYDVSLNVNITADVDVTYNNTLVNFTITVNNIGSGTATEVILTDSLPDTLIYSNWGIVNGNGAVITAKTLSNGVEFNISNITSGNFVSVWVEALTNGLGDLTNNVTVYCKENDTKVNGSVTITVILENETTTKHVDIGDAEIRLATGNPIFALLIVLSILGIVTKRRK